MVGGAPNGRHLDTIEHERLVDRICVAFEGAIQAGERPDFATYLRDAPIETEKVLLKELLLIALDYAGTTPTDRSASTRHLPTGPQIGRSSVCNSDDRPNGTPVSGTNCATTGGDLESSFDAGLTDSIPSMPRLFGDFDILEKVGHGGMGTVFRARQKTLNRLVALKVLNTQLGPSQRFGANEKEIFRFLRESIAAARQDHENIVTIFESGEFDGKQYVAMQFVEGPSLREMTMAGPLPNRRAAQYLLPICRAVHRMHALGVIHRDLKPSNILVESENDKPYVADFGLAKLLDEKAEVTLSGEMFGSLPYMPPEQVIDARNVGPAADVYALGATLYHLLTGRPPFQAASVTETISQIVGTQPLAPRQINPAISKDLDTICLKCLEKDSASRYATAELLADELTRYLEDRPIVARPPSIFGRLLRWSRRNRMVAGLLLIIFISLSAIASTTGIGLLREMQLVREIRAANDETRLQLSVRHVANADLDRIERLGNGLAWLSETIDLDQNNPHRQRIDRERIQAALRSYPDLLSMGWHDGPLKRVVVDSDGKRFVIGGTDDYLTVWDAGSRDPLIRLAETGRWTDLVISPDGRFIATSYLDGTIRVWNSARGNLVSREVAHDGMVIQLHFSADSHRLLTVGEDKLARVWAVTLQGAKPIATIPHPSFVTSGCLSSSGSIAATSCRDGKARVWDVATGKLLHEPLSHDATISDVQMSQQGHHILTVGTDMSVVVWPILSATRNGIKLAHEESIADAAFTDNGSHVITATRKGAIQLWRVSDGTAVGPEVRANVEVTRIACDPNGNHVLAVCADKAVRVWSIMDGTAVTPPIVHPQLINDASFTSGGCVITVSDDGCFRTWSIPVPVHTVRAEPLIDVVEVASSNDGKRLAVLHANQHVDVLNLLTGDVAAIQSPKRLLATTLAWHPDGDLLSVGCGDGVCQIWNSKEGQLQTIPVSDADSISMSCWSPDGRYLASITKKGTVKVWDSIADNLSEYMTDSQVAISCVRFDSISQLLLVVRGKDVLLWRLRAAIPQAADHHCYEHASTIIFADFLGNCDRIVTAANSGKCVVWDAANGTRLHEFVVRPGKLEQACVDSTSRFLATTSEGHLVQIWDLSNGVESRCSFALPSRLIQSCFTSGHAFTALLENGEVLSWDINTGEMLGPPISVGPSPTSLVYTPTHPSLRILTRNGSLVEVNGLLHSSADDYLVGWCRLIAGHRVDPIRGLVALNGEETRNLWISLAEQRENARDLVRTRLD